jgi:hypothetical protein
MSDKIKVRITATETVYHKKVVEMTQEEYDRYNSMEDETLSECMGDWMDRSSMDDGSWDEGNIEIVEDK